METLTKKLVYNAVPLRGIVMFPGITTNLELAREKSIKALLAAEADDGTVFFVAQRDSAQINIDKDGLFSIGIIAKIRKAIKLSNGHYQVLAEGISRAELVAFDGNGESYSATVLPYEFNLSYDKKESATAVAAAKTLFSKFIKYVPRPAEDFVKTIELTENPGRLADLFAAALFMKMPDKQAVLDETDELERLRTACGILEREIGFFELEGSIHDKVNLRLQRQQRNIYLREQLRVIQAELGINGEEGQSEEPYEYYNAIKKAKLPEEVRAKLTDEAEKLSRTPFGSAEGAVIRNYIECCLELPWEKQTKEKLDIGYTEKVLNADHDGLEKVKERILEYIAVKKLAPDLNGQILCLVGPPGVGKTSIVKSIARAVNRKYVRISLGGIKDEAEIRGHRKTYVGAMPGRIITALKNAGSSNPVMLLDEIDKLSVNAHNGDSSAALLEVLDSEQNKTFRDNFIELPFDLSECMFIATANTTDTLPAPLLDRMEIIRMDSYSESEKLAIAKNHLIPKQRKKHGLTKRMLKFEDEALLTLINGYTKESGVRNLEREIASICRKAAKEIVSENCKSCTINAAKLTEYLGAEKFTEEKIYDKDEVGIVNGLAWTQYGGDMLRIEAVSMNGSGSLELTGSLGDVMKESARAALSYIRKHADKLGVNSAFYKEKDIHIHVPEGAIPKDGPSAGITIATALLSELSGKAVKQDVAMTGELTLTGKVLRIGGLREKCSAACKAGIKKVIIPKENERDTNEIDAAVREKLTLIPVSDYSEAIPYIFN